MFWTRFNALCAEKGVSPNGLAKELKIPSGSITAWKDGAEPRNKTVVKIADYFGVSAAYLKGETDQKEKHTASSDGQLNAELIIRLCQLTPDEIQKVDAFVQGILASR